MLEPGTEGVVSALTQMILKNSFKPETGSSNEVAEEKTFTFYLELPGEDELLKTSIEVESQMTVQAALRKALENFEQIAKNKNITLNTDIENYTPRLSKKNGKPKTDMPSIDLKQKFIDIKVSSSSIQVRNLSAVKYNNVDIAAKTVSNESISTEIGINSSKKKQLVDDDEQVRATKKSQGCFFSFC